MAEDLRNPMPDPRPLERRREEIVKEAMRQSESCLFTSTVIYIWLRRVRIQHKAVFLLPIIITAIAGVGYFQEMAPPWMVAVVAFLATLIPSLADALDIQTHVDELKRLAAEYKSLQDRFRRLARITSLGDVDKAEEALGELMDRMDIARSSSLTPPQRYFKRARREIEGGNYDFAVDIATGQTLSGRSSETPPASDC